MSQIRVVVAALLLLVGLAAGGASFLDGLKIPAPVVPQPAGILAGVSRSDAAQLRAFYAAMSDIVVRDGSSPEPEVKGTLDLRNRHRSALKLAFANTGMVGKYPGLGDRLDAHLLQAIGETDVPLDQALRARAAKAFAQVE